MRVIFAKEMKKPGEVLDFPLNCVKIANNKSSSVPARFECAPKKERRSELL